MSGGTWDYLQFKFTEVIEDLKSLINKNGKMKTREEMKSETRYDPDWYEKYPEDKFHTKYSEEILERVKEALEYIELAQIYMQRLDWFLAGDDGEESFKSRLTEELKQYRKNKLNEKT